MKQRTAGQRRLLLIAFAALLFGEYREVGFSFWLGIVLIVLSVLIQSRRILRRKS